jgi:hypothetical protein
MLQKPKIQIRINNKNFGTRGGCAQLYHQKGTILSQAILFSIH